MTKEGTKISTMVALENRQLKHKRQCCKTLRKSLCQFTRAKQGKNGDARDGKRKGGGGEAKETGRESGSTALSLCL